jgi:hypothetical protein
MSTKSISVSLEEQRSRLERRANVIRSRLLRTIDALDNRRHQVQEIGHHAKRLAVPVGAALIGAVVVTAGVALGVRALIRHRLERRFTYRLSQALAPLRQPKRLPFWNEALRKVALTALGILASELTKRSARGLVNGRAPRALLGPGPVNEVSPAVSAHATPALMR